MVCWILIGKLEDTITQVCGMTEEESCTITKYEINLPV